MIRVLVNGAKGKMGQTTVAAVSATSDLQLAAQSDIDSDLHALVTQFKPDVAVDFTHPDFVRKNTLDYLEMGVRPVIGTTGLTARDLKDIDAAAKEKGLGALIVPNFAIGALLMMKVSAEIARYMDTCEIIEYHHNQKADAPSGTAIKTAQLIAQDNPNLNPKSKVKEKELIPGSRGAVVEGIPIHAVRLPGIVADQSVVFGAPGQTLTITHHTINREAFMPGVLLAIRKVMSLTGMVYGLESILFESESGRAA